MQKYILEIRAILVDSFRNLNTLASIVGTPRATFSSCFDTRTSLITTLLCFSQEEVACDIILTIMECSCNESPASNLLFTFFV